jgi:hypothetical protein
MIYRPFGRRLVMNRYPLAVLALLGMLAVACAPGPGDYMDADLRARVETLKAAAAAEPTTAENYQQRLWVLWDWANAYALTGGALPVHLPPTVGRLASNVTDGTEPPPGSLAAIDEYIRELTFKDEQPDAIGTLQFTSIDPLPIASWQSIEQTYTVGAKPMEPRAVVMVAKQLATDQGQFQHEDPAGDHYVSIRCSNPEATFERTTVPLSGMHGAYRGSPAPTIAFRLEGPALQPGETVTVVYGDTSGGSRGWRIQTWATARVLLPLYLDLDGSGLFLTPHWPGLEVIGSEVHAVRAVAPSVVAVGEPFELAVRSEDRFTNRATGAIPAYEVSLNGEPLTRIGASDDAITVLEDLTIDAPGVFRFTVRSDDGSLAALSNPVWVLENPPHRVYWGETHVHSDFAEGQGSPERLFTYARDDARLDFLTHSEHDVYMDDFEWQTLQDLARTSTEEGRFVAFLGYEWSVRRARGGHHNVLFRLPDRQRVGIHRADHLPELYRLLAEENEPDDVLIIPHAHQAGDWTQNDPELERLVEMYSMHGSFEWFGNFYLRNGFQIGFVGASDDHRARPGYARGVPMAPLAQLGGLAAVVAPSKTVDAIFNAMRSLSAYATSGQRIILDARLNGSRMGTRQEFTEERNITCRVMGTSPIDRIDVIKNGGVVFTRRYLTAPLEPKAKVLVGFESSSEVFGKVRDNPRAYRVWDGTLRVDGARVVGLSTPGFDNFYLERAGIDPDQENLIRFHTETRGRRDTMLVELEGASPSTRFTFHLEPAREVGMATGPVRQPALVPGADFELRLSGMTDSRLSHELKMEQFVDRVTVEVIDPDGDIDMDFEFTDLEDPRPGDYYYVRVTQLDGGRAWSSPFWVGEQEE